MKLKNQKQLFCYQEAAIKKLQEIGEKVNLRKNEITPLIKYGMKLKGKPFSNILKRGVSELNTYYIQHLKLIVVDESKRIEQPPDQIPPPSVPLIKETMLKRKVVQQRRLFHAAILTATDED